MVSRLRFEREPIRQGPGFVLKGQFGRLFLMLISISLFAVSGCSPKTDNVIVAYVLEDQVFSEPILKDFEKETGIRVKPIYDTEEAKSTGVRMFGPWYGDRPDDRAFLEEDKKRPDAFQAMQADAQGPHEAPVRIGEERILTWAPKLKAGSYTVQAIRIYDLNRYNERSFTEDQTEIYRTSLSVTVKEKE